MDQQRVVSSGKEGRILQTPRARRERLDEDLARRGRVKLQQDLDEANRGVQERLEAGLDVLDQWRNLGRQYALASPEEKARVGIPRYWEPCPALWAYLEGKFEAYQAAGAPLPAWADLVRVSSNTLTLCDGSQ